MTPTPVTAVSAAMFSEYVIAASFRQAVIVEFTVHWHADSRTLSAILDRLASQYGESIRFTRIDADLNRELAARHEVGGNPTVRAFFGGRVVDGFSGLVPEPVLRSFLDGLLPSRSEERRLSAARLRHHGQWEEAEQLLRQVLRDEPGNDLALRDLSELLLLQSEQGDAGESAHGGSRIHRPGAPPAVARAPHRENDDANARLAAPAPKLRLI